VEKYLIGIDAGTSMVKSVVFDDEEMSWPWVDKRQPY